MHRLRKIQFKSLEKACERTLRFAFSLKQCLISICISVFFLLLLQSEWTKLKYTDLTGYSIWLRNTFGKYWDILTEMICTDCQWRGTYGFTCVMDVRPGSAWTKWALILCVNSLSKQQHLGRKKKRQLPEHNTLLRLLQIDLAKIRLSITLTSFKWPQINKYDL